MQKSLLVLVAAGLAASSASAQLARLDAKINVDNVFGAYISTDPDLLGSLFLSGDNWQATSSGSALLPDAATYYLHVVATDQGGPRMFIGTFGLVDLEGQALFVNGTQQLLTNTTDWFVAPALGEPGSAPISFGLNKNGGTWGVRPEQSPDAQFIWYENTNASTVVFTTAIRVVPAPGVLALAGLAPLGLRRTRR